MSSLLIDDSQPGIRQITLNRPERMNALDGPTLEQFIATVKESSAPGKDIRRIAELCRALSRERAFALARKHVIDLVMADHVRADRRSDVQLTLA